MSARLVLVAALDSENGVGRDNALPWRLPEDLRRFRSLTLGAPVCYGRRTFESLGCTPLPDRLNVLLTSNTCDPLAAEVGVATAPSVAEALVAVGGPLVVAGGTRAWAEALELSATVRSVAMLTRVDGVHGCDAFFPVLPAGWRLVLEMPRQPGPPSSRFQVWSNF